MEWIRVLVSRIGSLFQRRELDARLDEELRAHIELAIEENLRRGMTADEARTAALREFGGVTQTREKYRVQRGLPWIGQAGRDVRFAMRQLRKSPGFTLTAILTLALGIGAATSVFSVVHAVLLKPFAFREPARLVVIREVNHAGSSHAEVWPFNYRHFLRLRKTATTLEDVAIFQNRALSVSPDGEHPHMVGGLESSPNLLPMLGVQPILGRGFTESDAVKGAQPVVLLSYNAWQTMFAGRADVAGQTLRLGGEPATVIGVLPAGLKFPQLALSPKIEYSQSLATREVQIYRPMVPFPEMLTDDNGMFNYKVMARLKDGVTVAQAASELETLQRAYGISAKLPVPVGAEVTPLAKDAAHGISGALWMLFAAVGAVLLIACVNLANLQLARAVHAEHETALRAALGAGRAQLVMARLTESVLLALAGGVAGAALAFVGVRVLVALAPANLPRLDEVHVSLPVLGFAAALSMVSAIGFGLLPALKSMGVAPQAALKANSARTANSQEGQRTRNGMMASQVACTVVLLIVTSLVLKSFSNLLREDRGFDTSQITMAQVAMLAPKYDDTKPGYDKAKLAFADRTVAALRALPGVQSVALTSAVPLTGETWVDSLERPDHPVPAAEQQSVNVRWINPDYLATMRMRLVAGRNITESDRANPFVALISERTAREGFGGENPIGHTLSNIVPDGEHPLTIVGVVADTRINGLKDDAAMVYVPYWTYVPWTISLMVRSARPDEGLIAGIRRAVWEIDPEVTIQAVKALDTQVNDSVAAERFQAIVLSCFGSAALALALLGVYGVLTYSVSLRQQEFGIRIALGSGKGTLIGLVLRQAAWPVLLGAGAGLAMAFVAMRWVRSLLYQTPVMDPMAIGGSILLLLAAAAVAAIVPARRAASVDPMQALRTE
jgi:predicted permease